MQPRELLIGLFRSAVAAVAAERVLRPATLPLPPRGRTLVLAAGKAAAAMAREVERCWPGMFDGIAITRYGHGLALERIALVEAGHPLPDEAGLAATRRALALAEALGADDLALCLISGGASALLVQPAAGIRFAEKQRIVCELLDSGASIGEINCVRKHLSSVKAGRLAQVCYPAPVVTLLVSDVPGDDPAVIGSGPTLPDPTTCADALEILDRYGLQSSGAVQRHLHAGAGETPKAGDPRLAASEVRIIARAADALAAAAAFGRACGYAVEILGDAIQGEARSVARADAARALAVAAAGPLSPPRLLLAGGETTVRVRGRGSGGRNSEYALSLALALDGHPAIHALAADTDGIDGNGQHAGAMIGPDTLARAYRAGMDPAAALENNDSAGLFAALHDLLVTGPTRTNVNDFRAILIEPISSIRRFSRRSEAATV